jgi:hypothetical protein
VDIDKVISLYADLDDYQKVDLLARVASYLTVAFRDLAYSQPNAPEAFYKLQGLNELQHHLTSQLLAHFHRDEARYPDDVFIRILTEKARHYGVSSCLSLSFNRYLTKQDNIQ